METNGALKATHEIERPARFGDLVSPFDTEGGGERFFEHGRGKLIADLLSVSQKALHHWIFMIRKLNDQPRAYPGQERSHAMKRNVSRNAKMMNEGERHRQIRSSSVHKPRSFSRLEAVGSRGVGQVDSQRQHIGVLTVPGEAVVLIHAERIDIAADGLNSA
jgi:hypothetical protein